MGRYGASQFSSLDKNHDGKLCFAEFKRGFAGFFSTIGSTLVDIYDADGNGVLIFKDILANKLQDDLRIRKFKTCTLA